MTRTGVFMVLGVVSAVPLAPAAVMAMSDMPFILANRRKRRAMIRGMLIVSAVMAAGSISVIALSMAINHYFLEGS